MKLRSTHPETALRTQVEKDDVLGLLVSPQGALAVSLNKEFIVYLPDARVGPADKTQSPWGEKKAERTNS